jgi:hypothetical protein
MTRRECAGNCHKRYPWRKAMARLAERSGERINGQMARTGEHNTAKTTGNRKERLAAALRENLRRRKEQERGRDASPSSNKGSSDPPVSRTR